AKAALTAGHNVVATGRNIDAVAEAVGEADDLLVVKLDVISTADARAAVQAATGRFGRIDVLVNNAASFYAGYFEELTPEQTDRRPDPARLGAPDHRRRAAAAAPLHRRRRRDRAGRAARHPVPGGDRRVPRPVVVAGARLRRGRKLITWINTRAEAPCHEPHF